MYDIEMKSHRQEVHEVGFCRTGSEKMPVLSVMLHLWLQLSLAPFGSLNMSSFEKNEVRNVFLTFIFLSICHTFRTFF